MSVVFNGTLMERDAAAKGLSGTALARRARISQQTVSRFFRGGAIRPETAQRLARVLDQPIERYLLNEREPAEVG